MQVHRRSLEVEALQGTPSITQHHAGERTAGTERKMYQIIHHYNLCKVFSKQKKGSATAGADGAASKSKLRSKIKSVRKETSNVSEQHGIGAKTFFFTTKKKADKANDANNHSLDTIWTFHTFILCHSQ